MSSTAAGDDLERRPPRGCEGGEDWLPPQGGKATIKRENRRRTGGIAHVHAVLNYLDIYMIETHGQNDEWQNILNSF